MVAVVTAGCDPPERVSLQLLSPLPPGGSEGCHPHPVMILQSLSLFHLFFEFSLDGCSWSYQLLENQPLDCQEKLSTESLYLLFFRPLISFALLFVLASARTFGKHNYYVTSYFSLTDQTSQVLFFYSQITVLRFPKHPYHLSGFVVGTIPFCSKCWLELNKGLHIKSFNWNFPVSLYLFHRNHSS